MKICIPKVKPSYYNHAKPLKCSVLITMCCKIKNLRSLVRDLIWGFEWFFFQAVEDNYHTVAFKLYSAFKWIYQASTGSDFTNQPSIEDVSKGEGQGSSQNSSKTTNLKWILKLDDDVLLNVGKLSQFLETIQDNDSIYCRVFPHDPPHRANTWFVQWEIS